MKDTTRQSAEGKVLMHFSMSLDGFVAGPGHAMDWIVEDATTVRASSRSTSGRPAVLGGRDGWDSDPQARPYGDGWRVPIFVLTHHPEDAEPAEDVTFLSCDVAEAVRIGLAAADGKNLEVHSPTIGRQLLQRGLVDELDLHISPVLLGDGIRLFDNPGGDPIRLELRNGDDPLAEVNLRYHPVVGTRAG